MVGKQGGGVHRAGFDDGNQVTKDFISPSEWFGDLPDNIQALFVGRMVAKCLTDGEMLHARGDEPKGLYRIFSGQIKVSSVSPGGKEFVLAYLEPGHWFGEISLFDGSPRTHDAHALGETHLEVLNINEFNRILTAHPELYRYFYKLICNRLRMAFHYIEESAF